MPSAITPIQTWARNHARIRNEYVSQGISEFVGTLILCTFAIGAGAQIAIRPDSHMMAVFGGVFGLMVAVTATGGLSGAHINPAVTFALALAGHLSWKKVPVYWFFQLLGGYVGAGIGFSVHKLQLQGVFGDDLTAHSELIGIFSHHPVPQVAGFIGTGLADQILTTSILLIAIFASIDPRNMGIPKWFLGPFFALTVAGIAFTFGVNAGSVMNPARDLGPRLMAVTIGWNSSDVFMYRDTENPDQLRHYWIIPLFGPFIGAFIGTIVYIFLIGSHLPDLKQEIEAREKNNNNNQDDGWRSTHFIPKAVIPQELHTSPSNPSLAPSYSTAVLQNNNPYARNGGPHVINGVQNPVFVKDDGRPRHY